MGYMSPMAKFNNTQPKPNSKRQQLLAKDREEHPEKYVKRYIACNKCHRTGVTLRRGPDSYYCTDCYNELMRKKKEK